MKYLHWCGIAELFEKNGGQGRNRTADTRIFSEQISLSNVT